MDADRTVLIIEDDFKDFKSIAKKFEDSWNILPNQHSDYAKLFNENRKQELNEFIKKLILQNYQSIGIIILDITLFGPKSRDRYGLETLLSMIRNLKFKEEYESWPKQVPIIAFTRHNTIEYKRLALSTRDHVHTYIAKDQDKEGVAELQLTAEALHSIFKFSLFSIETSNIKELLNKAVKLLNQNQKNYAERLESIISAVRVNNKETKRNNAMMNILLSASLIQMPKEHYQTFMEEFALQIERLGYDASKFRHKLEDSNLKQQLAAAFKKGIFTEVLDLTYQICEEEKVFELPGGYYAKIASLGILSLTRILSKIGKEKG